MLAPWRIWQKGRSFRGARIRRAAGWQSTLAAEVLEVRAMLAVNVLTFHNDNAGTGANTDETALTPVDVVPNARFGKLFTTNVDGQVYAQPLIDTGVTITVGPNTSAGAAGVHDVVYVATQHDSLYAIDTSTGSVLWQRSFLNLSDALPGATAITSVPNGVLNSADITPEVGITGTPVIDTSNGVLYVVAKTAETVSGTVHYVQRLHAVNLGNGTDQVTPYLIGDTSGTNTNQTQIYVYGTGDGSVTDPYNGTGRAVVQFNARRGNQRAALSLVNNTVYVAWASHGDNGPYHGWVVGWNVSQLSTQGLKVSGVFNNSPNGGLAGIWQGAGHMAFEDNGSAFYLETGNGPVSHPVPTLDANGFPTDGNYYNALIKVVADSTTSPTNQNKNGWGFKVADYFIPYNQGALDSADQDFGSGAPTLLPDTAGIPGHPHLLVASGKEGKIYLVDRDNLGHFDPTGDHVLNAVSDGAGHNTPPKQIGGILSTQAFYNGKLYAVSGYNDVARAFTINANGTLTATSQTTNTFGYLPGSPSISALGTTNGIVWITDRNTNVLHAYDAGSLGNELWNSSMKGGNADAVGSVIKFAVPTVANGQVFVGTANSLVVYGLKPPASSAPQAPTLSGDALSGTSVNLTWTDPTAEPNTASGYKIETSTDNANFTQVTTAPAGFLSLALGGLAPLTTYYIRIRGFNIVDDSPYSNVITLTTTNQVALLDFSAGFGGSTSTLTYNGSAAISGANLRLTNGAGYQAGSTFSTSPVDITKFTSQFMFQLTAATNTADGFTFAIQGVGPTALGAFGGGLGYGTDGVTSTTRIANSVAVKFDLYSNAGEGVNSTGLYANGADPTNAGSTNLTGTGIDLHSGRPIRANLSYNGTTLTVILTDTVTNASATQTYAVNIPSLVGGALAYVGFTGGTGGFTATQDILNWTFSPGAGQAPGAPSALGAQPASATSVALNWTNQATNQTGFKLDRATDADFTQNLITQNLPATPNSFTDTAVGLNPAGTYYYRIRATNTAGDSVNSAAVTVSIPVAPAKATDAMVTAVSSTQIDLSWTDNAGRTADGYLIQRRIGNGTFTNYATLPALNSTPPDEYTWSDTNLTPGTTYEYHILAVNVSGNNDFVGANATTIPLAPAGVVATGGGGTVNLSWTTTTGALRYNIYRGTASGAETFLQSVTSPGFSDSTGTIGTKYFYTVTAVNNNVNHVPVLPAESLASAEVSATPLANTGFSAHINFTRTPATSPANYVADTGQLYGNRGNGLTYGWNVSNTANALDRNNSTSPNELYDSLAQMQAASNANAYWGIAVPNGTYLVHLIAGDPSSINSVYRINVGGTRSGTQITGGTLAVSGTPTNATHWFENSVTVTVTGGVLYVSNGTGSRGNKVDAIDITSVTPAGGVNFGSGFAGATGLTLNGAAAINGANLRLTSGSSNQNASAFTSSLVNIAAFTTSFNFRFGAGATTADGFTFTIQGNSSTALGANGGGLGYGRISTGASIGKSLAIKFDLYSNSGEGANSTGLYTNGAAPTNASSINLTSSGINLHSGDLMMVTLAYDGTTLTETIFDTITGATFTRQYVVNIRSLLGSSLGFVGFTAGTGGRTVTTNITSWNYIPR